ncbi:AraC family transcriptional regulator [uncultured Croceitalea sp.]|uniref:AraC family transcriptional regulator n=1 Tax=uncultured Croceitalea sp. TaxID=1798908 RepID=UPI003305A7B9
MIFESHKLAHPLQDYIESIFYYKGYIPEHSIERVVPTGHIFIIFELDGFERHTYDSKTLAPNGNFKNVWISGMHKNFLSISAHQDSEMLVVQFKPSGSYPFLHVPIHQLNNTVVGAKTLFGDSILQLREQVLEKNETVEKFRLIENWLVDRLDYDKVPDSSLIAILKQLCIKSIAEGKSVLGTYPKTQKHLISQFKKYFGLTPKVFHRIFRFNEILKQIHNKEQLLWSQIAHEFGYSDQSHFIKEFKEFSGFNPEEFIKSDFHKGEPNFFPLDKEG